MSFHSVLFCCSIDEKIENNFRWEPLSCVVCSHLVSVWFFSRYSSFLSYPQGVHVRLIGVSQLSQYGDVGVGMSAPLRDGVLFKACSHFAP